MRGYHFGGWYPFFFLFTVKIKRTKVYTDNTNIFNKIVLLLVLLGHKKYIIIFGIKE